ncbi:hypothetical protein SDJN03_07082, partial [Cucurbita argyrosperma subsp. sororia]
MGVVARNWLARRSHSIKRYHLIHLYSHKTTSTTAPAHVRRPFFCQLHYSSWPLGDHTFPPSPSERRPELNGGVFDEPPSSFHLLATQPASHGNTHQEFMNNALSKFC